jgi:hypothetical protein
MKLKFEQCELEGFTWIAIKVGTQAVGYIARNNALDKFFLARIFRRTPGTSSVTDYGPLHFSFEGNFKCYEDARQAILNLPVRHFLDVENVRGIRSSD